MLFKALFYLTKFKNAIHSSFKVMIYEKNSVKIIFSGKLKILIRSLKKSKCK